MAITLTAPSRADAADALLAAAAAGAAVEFRVGSEFRLQTATGDAVTERNAACKHLAGLAADEKTKAALLGGDAITTAVINDWLSRRHSIFAPVTEESMAQLNARLLPRTYIAGGAAPSLADLVLAAVVSFAVTHFPAAQVAHYPAVARWYDHLAATAATDGGAPPLLPRAVLDRPPLRHPELAAAAPAAAAKKGEAKEGAGEKGGKKGAGAPAADATAASGDKKKKDKKAKAPAAPAPPARPLDDVAALDLRVGKVITADKHPDADSLYVETIDLGDPDGPRTVVSGLAKFVPLDAMVGRAVVCVCNLKPAAMRGVKSAAMVLCASAGERVVPVAPPAGATPGARVAAVGHPGEPEAQLNPKKKQFEAVAAHLATDGAGAACFKGAPLEVAGVGPVMCAEVPNGAIK